MLKGGPAMKITIREPGSAITHFIAFMLTVFAAMPLLAKAGLSGNAVTVCAMMVFMGSMALLYGASTLYHAANVGQKILKIFRRLDHMMIYVLIAGSYTPVCLLVLDKNSGTALLTAVWGIAVIGSLVTMFWINCPKWVSSLIYIAMGWVCVFVIKELFAALSSEAFLWLLAGGIIYTVGGVIYALKLPLFNAKHEYFGSHEIFHLFVMAGSICHFIFMFRFIA